MKSYLIILCSLFIISIPNYCQTLQYKTYYGYKLKPVDTIRALNIFVNIIYDQCGLDTCDPCRNSPTVNWIPGSPNTINENPPSYLNEYMDIEYNSNNLQGSFTKRYAEASFKDFIILGDFIIVNITQSRITSNNPNSSFSYQKLMDSTISLINNLGGLQTIYGHNSINDYDGNYSSARFLPKNAINNGNLDIVQFWIRNCTGYFGDLDGGGKTNLWFNKSLLIDGVPHKADVVTYQGRLGNNDLSYPEAQPADIHEIMHNLIGMTNSAHMGGGGPLNVGDLITLEANSGGWSLIGSATTSMITCNGFERWRLDSYGRNNLCIKKDYPSRLQKYLQACGIYTDERED